MYNFGGEHVTGAIDLEFLGSVQEGICGGGKNLRINGDKIIHYQTPIAERKAPKDSF